MQPTNQRIAVYGFIQNKDGKIILVKRSATDSSPGLWEMPGGALEYGEQPEQGVIREVKEETNLEVEVLHPLYVLSGFSKRTPEIQVLRIAFLCRITHSSQTSLSAEHSACEWIDPKQLSLSPLSDLVQKTVKTILDHPLLLSL